MTEGGRREDAFRSALERLPMAVVLVDGQRRLQPYNTRATELFERESLRGDLVEMRPSHPLAAIVRVISSGSAIEEHTAVFPSGAKYRIVPSRQSPKGVGRWLMLLITPAEEGRAVSLDDFDFTRREREVAQLLAQGKLTGELCSELGITQGTFKTHLRRLFAKTGARTRAEFVAKLLRTK